MTTATPKPAGTNLRISLDDLDWEALEAIETLVGHPITKEFDESNLSIRTVRAMVLWTLRKTDPTMTFETMPDLRSLELEILPGSTAQRSPLVSSRRRVRSRS